MKVVDKPKQRAKSRSVEGIEFIEISGGGGPVPDIGAKLEAFYGSTRCAGCARARRASSRACATIVIVVDASVSAGLGTSRLRRAASLRRRRRHGQPLGVEELVAPRVLVHECSYRLLKFGRSKRWSDPRSPNAPR
jgi:hypothetical protein